VSAVQFRSTNCNRLLSRGFNSPSLSIFGGAKQDVNITVFRAFWPRGMIASCMTIPKEASERSDTVADERVRLPLFFVLGVDSAKEDDVISRFITAKLSG